MIKLSRTSLHWPEWDGPSSFALGVGCFTASLLMPGVFYRCFPVWPYNAFRRVHANPSDNCWGFGLLQVSSRHLFYVGSNEEEFKIDVAFVHVVRRVATREAATS